MFEYDTIVSNAEGEFKDKGSKFLAYTFPFSHENQLKGIIDEIHRNHPKARHVCYAYRLDVTTFRSVDDGEPSGSAGKPILNAILSEDLYQVLVAVVRYFGGTLLGVPGLISAYRNSAKEALQAAGRRTITIKTTYLLELDNSSLNPMMLVIKKLNASVLNFNYTERYQLTVEIENRHIQAFEEELRKFYQVTFEIL